MFAGFLVYRKLILKKRNCCAGKIAAAVGHVANGTLFEMENMDELQLQLVEHGFDYGGRETLYNGVTTL